MGTLTQLCTEASRRDECFTKGFWPSAGMGYVFSSDDGGLLVIDGGETEKDAEALVSLLERLAGGKKPEVGLWLITHSHRDHYGALRNIAHSPALSARVRVRRLCCCTDIPVSFPEYDQEQVKELPTLLGCERIVPHAGDVLDSGDLTVRILYTWENDPELSAAKSFNRLSMIFTVANSSHRAMFVGDSTPVGPSFVRKNVPPEQLRSDFLQLAHHGLDGGDMEFYRAVAPQTVLIPCSLGGAKFIKAPETACNYNNRYMQDRALSVICACMGQVTMEF